MPVDVEGWRPPWRMVVLDTLKHPDCLIAKLMSQPGWKAVRMPRAEQGPDGSWRSCVPELFSDAFIQREVSGEQRAGTFESYCREMLCVFSDPSYREWTSDMFQYYGEGDVGFDVQTGRGWYRYIIADPARTMGSKSAYTAMLCWAVHPESGKVVIRDEFNARVSPEELEAELFDWVDRYNVQDVAIEETGLNQWIRQWMMNAAIRRGRPVRFIWIDGGNVGPLMMDVGGGRHAAKRLRAATLRPLYRPDGELYPKGHVWHSEKIRGGGFEQALLSYPDLVYWDLIDCGGHIPRVLQNDGHYFQPRVVGETRDAGRVASDKFVEALRAGVWRTA